MASESNNSQSVTSLLSLASNLNHNVMNEEEPNSTAIVSIPNIFKTQKTRNANAAKKQLKINRRTISRNITEKFKKAQYRSTSGSKEYSKAGLLISNAFESKYLRDPRLNFGNLPFSEIILLLVVKEWQLNRNNLVSYNTLLLSSGSPCLKISLANQLETRINLIEQNDEKDTDNDEYLKIIKWVKSSYSTEEEFNNLGITMSKPLMIFTLFKQLAQYIANGFVGSSPGWFIYDEYGNVTGFTAGYLDRTKAACGTNDEASTLAAVQNTYTPTVFTGTLSNFVEPRVRNPPTLYTPSFSGKTYGGKRTKKQRNRKQRKQRKNRSKTHKK